MNDRTTVVVITHNYAHFLRTALASAVDQTRRPRVLIMDDASIDGTQELVSAFLRQHSWIEYYRSPVNCGLSAMRNEAAKRATTHWIVYLDADDWLHPQFVERGEQWLDRHPDYDVLTTDMIVVRSGRRPFVSKTAAPKSWRDLTRKNTIVQTSFIRRTMVLELGGYDGTLDFEDWDFWIRVLKAGHLIGRLPGPHVYRREHGQNKSKVCDEMLATCRIRERHPLT